MESTAIAGTGRGNQVGKNRRGGLNSPHGSGSTLTLEDIQQSQEGG